MPTMAAAIADSGPPNGRSASPANLPSPSPSRGEQRGSQSPDAEKLEASELLDPDQKIKKRIQNRVAQRTYRKDAKSSRATFGADLEQAIV